MLIETMQKRINEIKQQDRKSYYEIANEIGISESTLYKLMSKGELFTPAEQKIRKYLKDYKLKDEQIEQWKHEYEVLDACCELAQGKITELKAENDRLKEEIKEVKKYQYQQEYLDKEIERLKAEFEIESLTNKTTGETIYRSNLVNKLKELLKIKIENLCESCGASSMMPMPCTVYKQILQEIKKYIAKICKEECGYVQKKRCPDCDCRFGAILDLITKAGEE